jgi:hypothetical protein
MKKLLLGVLATLLLTGTLSINSMADGPGPPPCKTNCAMVR